jgi:hypothetical protein
MNLSFIFFKSEEVASMRKDGDKISYVLVLCSDVAVASFIVFAAVAFLFKRNWSVVITVISFALAVLAFVAAHIYRPIFLDNRRKKVEDLADIRKKLIAEKYVDIKAWILTEYKIGGPNRVDIPLTHSAERDIAVASLEKLREEGIVHKDVNGYYFDRSSPKIFMRLRGTGISAL